MKPSTTMVGATITADYALGISGNANEGETINMQDAAQIELTIPGRARGE